MIEPNNPRTTPRLPDLGYLELEVLTLVTNGRSNAEIAEALDLPIREVKATLRSIYARLGFVRRSQAVVWGAEQGLYDFSSIVMP